MLTTGALVTMRVMWSQNPCSFSSGLLSENRLRNPIERKSTLCPSSVSTAGSSVSVAASVAMTTMIAPSASDW